MSPPSGRGPEGGLFMDGKDQTNRLVSWRRVALLVALGASGAMAFTPPGKWAAWELLEPLRSDLRTCMPLFLTFETGAASRQIQLMRACSDVSLDACDPRRLPLTLELLAERLAGLDGWSTAVLYDTALGSGALYAAGLDDIETCGRIVGPPWRRPLADSFAQTNSLLHFWRLVLLDDHGQGVGALAFTTRRPGGALSATEADVYVPDPSAPADPPLPDACIFRRGADGEVRRG
ncbi:MAG TPA: hypothetical protein VFY71_17965 [Planctomycetota bacterium]|nr:hypothetical protein [Planctomycetota bacterium]